MLRCDMLNMVHVYVRVRKRHTCTHRARKGRTAGSGGSGILQLHEGLVTILWNK